MESQDPFDIETKIQINIVLDSATPLLIIGTVVRSEKVGPDNHEISIAFLDSDKITRNEISSYLIKHLKDLPQALGTTQIPS